MVDRAAADAKIKAAKMALNFNNIVLELAA
jgi:hypothetical protein